MTNPRLFPLDRRALLAGASSLIAAPALAQAPAWPTRHVTIVVAFPAGGAADIVARLLGERLSQVWGQNVIVENRPGAGGNVAGAAVARADADGHTFLITSSSAAVNQFLYKTMPYDPFKDIAPVSLAVAVPNVMVVPASSPDRSIADFIARAKANPGKVNFGSAGVGTSIHLAGELFKQLAKIDMAHVPYRGAAPAMTDLIGGRIDVMFDTLTVSMPQIRAGSVRALGVSTKEKLASLPDVPTIASAVPGYEVLSWFALFAPANAPGAIVTKASADIAEALKHPTIAARLADLAANAVGSTPQALAETMRAEAALWGPVIRSAGVQPAE